MTKFDAPVHQAEAPATNSIPNAGASPNTRRKGMDVTAPRNAPEEKPNSVVGVTKYVECKLADLRELLQIQLDDVKQHLHELRTDTVTQKQHESLILYLDEKAASMDKAVLVTAESLEKRLDTLNELRQVVVDRDQMFLTKAEYEVIRYRHEADIKDLQLSRATMQGKASVMAVIGAYVLAVLGILVQALSAVYHVKG